MHLKAEIHKQIGTFSLDINIESNASRIGILGPSGSGKSMTLRSIAGIENPDSGYIELCGRVLYDSASGINLGPQKRNVGYMFQNYALFPTMSVLGNVCCGLKGSKKDVQARAMDMIERMGLAGMEHMLPGELSGGQQQRVALARILVCQPEMILLDEPFSALDEDLRERMQDELMELLADYRGIVVMVSHNRVELYRFSQDLFLVRDGHVTDFRHSGKIADNADNIDIREEQMEFSHFDDNGNAHMVDVSEKDITHRRAIAEGKIHMSREAMDAVLGKKVKKGDVLTVAQIAGIMGAKKTSQLIPLCHLITLNNVSLTFSIDEQESSITATCTAACDGKTGAEMEALTGVSTALLTIYDMCKAIDKQMILGDIHLIEKTGGKSDSNHQQEDSFDSNLHHEDNSDYEIHALKEKAWDVVTK